MDVIYSLLGECPIGYEALEYTFKGLVLIICIGGVFDMFAAWTMEFRNMGRG